MSKKVITLEKLNRFWTKVKTYLGQYILKTDIVNTFTSTDSSKVAAATTVKTLKDEINQLNTKIAYTDFSISVPNKSEKDYYRYNAYSKVNELCLTVSLSAYLADGETYLGYVGGSGSYPSGAMPFVFTGYATNVELSKFIDVIVLIKPNGGLYVVAKGTEPSTYSWILVRAKNSAYEL